MPQAVKIQGISDFGTKLRHRARLPQIATDVPAIDGVDGRVDVGIRRYEDADRVGKLVLHPLE